MIEQSVRIHDRYSFEIKLGFTARRKIKQSQFLVNTWLFVPASIDVNRSNYSKTDFYRDLKSNVRLITPVYLLRDIAGEDNTPFIHLRSAFENLASHPTRTTAAEYEYHIRMFLSILKSALRDEISHITQNSIPGDRSFLIDSFVTNSSAILSRYRSLRRIINVPTIEKRQMDYYLFGDEFMSNLVEHNAFILISGLAEEDKLLSDNLRASILNLIRGEVNYKQEAGYQVVSSSSPEANRELVFRLGMLKKYAENELFIKTNKKRDNILIEQVYLSIAAGISMVFATAIAFSFQTRFGNLTLPLFVALVVSYMLKDRIKEIARYYFAHRIGRRYFDHKTTIELSGNKIGYVREAMDFISGDKVPEDIYRVRDRSPILEANNRANSEKIILYRKYVRLNRDILDRTGRYSIGGVNEILRFNLTNMTAKMDDPYVPLYALSDDEKGFNVVKGEKIYYINMVMHLKNEEQSDILRYRLSFNRNGLRDIERF